jgi:hypothetical protein
MAVVLLAACSPGGHESGAASLSSIGPVASQACEPAPEYLRAFLEGGLSVRGATLSDMVVVAATQVEVHDAGLSNAFEQGWWVAARITGAGVRPELVAWLASSLRPASAAQVAAANPTARRDWSGSSARSELDAAGLATAMACVGPIPPA